MAVEQVVIPVEPGVDPATVPPVEDEKLFAGKYKTAEDLENGYNELVKKLGVPEVPAKETPPVDPAVPPVETSAAKVAQETAEAVGVDMEALTAEYDESGSLSDATYESLASKGLSKDLVDKHISLLQLEADTLQAEVYDSVGGEETYSSLIDWAGNNLNASEIQAFDAAVASSKEQAKLAVQGLFAKYQDANGSDPQGLIQGKPSVSGGDAFQSWAQVTEAMSDPKYNKDSAYRDAVQAKLGRSKNI